MRASRSLIGCPRPARLFHEPMAQGDALVEDEASAVPAALGLGNLLEIFQDTALEVEDLVEALRQHVGARLLASDAAGAEHGDALVPAGIELVLHEILE